MNILQSIALCLSITTILVACGAPKNLANSTPSPSPTPEVIVAETATPSPLVTLKPTATPTPKKTPVPTPPKKASATLPPVNMDITAQKFTEAEEQYLTTATRLAQKVSETKLKLDAAVTAKPFVIAQLPPIVEAFTALLAEISAIKVPSKYNEVNTIFIQAVTAYEKSAKLYFDGASKKDGALLNQAYQLSNEGDRKREEGQAKLATFK
ncbi:MAG: hypothetical protein H7Y41_05685 [Hyphomonadaceae bacterium]|nr:hypothetical protein [Clostridia bacterium]